MQTNIADRIIKYIAEKPRCVVVMVAPGERQAALGALGWAAARVLPALGAGVAVDRITPDVVTFSNGSVLRVFTEAQGPRAVEGMVLDAAFLLAAVSPRVRQELETRLLGRSGWLVDAAAPRPLDNPLNPLAI